MLVALYGLTSRPELNGSTGELLRYDWPARHWDVKVQSVGFEKNFIVAVSSANLTLAPTLCPGAVAEFCGVERRPELNGQRCVLERFDGTSERWAVTFGNRPREHLLLLKPANLRATPPPSVNTHLTARVSVALELSCMRPPPGDGDLKHGSMFLEMRLYLMREEEEVTGGMCVLEVSAWPMATRRSVSIAILPWTPLAIGFFTPEAWAWWLALALNKANAEWRAAGRALRPLGGYGADRLFVRIDGGRLHPSDPLGFAVRFERTFLSIAAELAAEAPPSFFARPADAAVRISWLPAPALLSLDPALCFDVLWYWQRAGELLGCPLEDRSAQPACTYAVPKGTETGEPSEVFDAAGEHFASVRAYIRRRLDAAAAASQPAGARRGEAAAAA